MNNAKINYRIYCKKFFREFEVSKHSKLGDCWMIIDGYVLDLSELTKTANKINEDSLVSLNVYVECVCLMGLAGYNNEMMNNFFVGFDAIGSI